MHEIMHNPLWLHVLSLSRIYDYLSQGFAWVSLDNM